MFKDHAFSGKARILKKLTLMALTAALILLLSLMAANAQVNNMPAGPGGGFSGPGPNPITVERALAMRDDAKVTLRGNLVKGLGGKMYLFQDATGTIEVEIDAKAWQGQTIGPEDVVIISGEIDKDWRRVSIDVDYIIKQPNY